MYTCDEQTDLEQFLKKIAEQKKSDGLRPHNFSQRLEFFKNLAKRTLKKSGLIDQPHYYTKSEPDKLRIGHIPINKLENIKISYNALEPYVRAKGFEADSPEDYAARILDTISLIEKGKDPEKMLDDAFHLGELVTRAYVDGFISKRSCEPGKRSGISRQGMKAPFHKNIVNAAKSLLNEGYHRREISSLLSKRFGVTSRQIGNILKKNEI